MTRPRNAQSARAGFGPHGKLSGPFHRTGFVVFTAKWNGQPARNRDGTEREFLSPDIARAWLAAADATAGASFRHQCS